MVAQPGTTRKTRGRFSTVAQLVKDKLEESLGEEAESPTTPADEEKVLAHMAVEFLLCVAYP